MTVITTSRKQDWKTPGGVYRDLDKEFHFDYDPCPPDPKLDGLHVAWGNSNFVNPPYNQIKAWLKKAIHEWRLGKTVVLLLPSRTGTDWFHECVIPFAVEIRYIRGRLQFDDCGVNAPFDSIIVVYCSGKP